MTKRTIVRWWVGGLLACVPAGILIPASTLALAAHDAGLADGYGRTMAALLALGALCALGGLGLQLVAWGGAVGNTQRLADPRWGRALRRGGVAGLATIPLVGLGVLVLLSVMLAYLVAGPDALVGQTGIQPPAKRTVVAWGEGGFALGGVGLLAALGVANLTNPGHPLHGVVWPALALVSAGLTLIVVGGLLVAAAWWGALFNAHALADPRWFRRLRGSGIAAAVTMPLLGFGMLILAVVLIAYQHAAPDALVDMPVGTATAPAAQAPTRP